MCKNAYEQISQRTGKTMIFCKLSESEDEISQLCVGQRYCSKKDKYIEHNQKENCKRYKQD